MRKNYLLFLIVLGLITLSVYSTYAMFTASIDTGNIVNLTSATLEVDSKIVEYERLTIEAGETKTIKFLVTNSTTTTKYYGVWYEMIKPTAISEDIQVAKSPDTTSDTFGSLNASASTEVLLVIVNDTSSSIIVNIGVAYSDTNSLNLPTDRYLITEEYVKPIIITFNGNGGMAYTTSLETNMESKLDSLPIATRDNYTFNGWFTAASGGEQITTDTVFTKDITVYAQWTAVTSTITVTGGSYYDARGNYVDFSNYSYLVINGSKVHTAGTYRVNAGDVITCYVKGESARGSSSIISNNTVVASGSGTTLKSYTYTVRENVNVTINLSYTSSKSLIEITENGVAVTNAIITVAGSGEINRAYLTINGYAVTTAGQYNLTVGDTIVCYAYLSGLPFKVYLNGQTIVDTKISGSYSYNYVVTGNATIDVAYKANAGAFFTITE